MKDTNIKELENVKVGYQSIADVVCDKLRQAIIEGVFPPGEQLIEREVASFMGVSTTPIKTALQRLAHEGLINTVPFRGSFVADNIATLLTEIGLIRASLEGTAAYLAAMKVSDENVETLQSQINEMERSSQLRDIAGAIEANAQFHELIHEISHNHALSQMASMVRRYSDITRSKALSDHEQMDKGLEEHKAVFEAIKARDPQRAEAKMREHILRNTSFLEHYNDITES